jgi:hypothetical protein
LPFPARPPFGDESESMFMLATRDGRMGIDGKHVSDSSSRFDRFDADRAHGVSLSFAASDHDYMYRLR